MYLQLFSQIFYYTYKCSTRLNFIAATCIHTFICIHMQHMNLSSHGVHVYMCVYVCEIACMNYKRQLCKQNIE